MSSFDSLGLAETLVRAVHEAGYQQPTPIQQRAIPAILTGKDLLAGAQTGTGKTAGFTLPVLHRLLQGRSAGHRLRALVLTPTRELAAQVAESVRIYGKYTGLKSGVIFGGVGMQPQIQMVNRGVDLLVATPGRLLDLQQQGHLSLAGIEILVLDEADRMLDMGFIHDIKKVLALLPAQRQNLLFSATFSDEIKALADRLLDHPEMIEVTPRNSTVEVVAQKIHPVDRDKKHPLLAHLIKTHSWQQVLVFTRTKHGANRLVEQLGKEGISALAIHGNKSQSARTKALSEFKDGRLTALVATDIAARGIDIDQLPHVVNYDLPNVPEDYVHRIGRTGRAGAQGEAVSLVCVDEHKMLADIEKLIRRSIPREVVDAFTPDPTAKPQPIQLRSFEGRRPPVRSARPASSGGAASRTGEGARNESKRSDPARPAASGKGHARPAPRTAGSSRSAQHKSGR